MDILSAPPVPIKKVPSIVHHTYLKPIVRAPQTQLVAAASISTIKRPSVLSGSFVRPPLGSTLRQQEIQTTTARQPDTFSRQTITKPSPADLVTSRSYNQRTSYEETCEEVRLWIHLDLEVHLWMSDLQLLTTLFTRIMEFRSLPRCLSTMKPLRFRQSSTTA